MMKRSPMSRVPRKIKRYPEKRFLKQLAPGAVSERRPDLGPCLLFMGARNSNGYGQFRYLERNSYAHRYAWERAHGAIPAGMTIDHLCMVKTCVEITHLEVVTGVENFHRYLASRTHCKNGHELTTRGKCRECIRDAWRRDSAKSARVANGLPDRRIAYDQELVRSLILEVRDAQSTITQAAREIGCNPNYLGRRIWRETRLDVLARDEDHCLRCGSSGPLDVHHRVPRGAGGAEPRISFGMDNLVTLCRSCHRAVESDRTQAFDDGWLVHRGTDPSTVSVLRPAGWHTVQGRTAA